MYVLAFSDPSHIANLLHKANHTQNKLSRAWISLLLTKLTEHIFGKNTRRALPTHILAHKWQFRYKVVTISLHIIIQIFTDLR